MLEEEDNDGRVERLVHKATQIPWDTKEVRRCQERSRKAMVGQCCK